MHHTYIVELQMIYAEGTAYYEERIQITTIQIKSNRRKKLLNEKTEEKEHTARTRIRKGTRKRIRRK